MNCRAAAAIQFPTQCLTCRGLMPGLRISASVSGVGLSSGRAALARVGWPDLSAFSEEISSLPRISDESSGEERCYGRKRVSKAYRSGERLSIRARPSPTLCGKASAMSRHRLARLMEVLMITANTVERMKPRFRGELIARGDPSYDGARKVFNASIDRKPGRIARRASSEDVVKATKPRKPERTVVRAARPQRRGLCRLQPRHSRRSIADEDDQVNPAIPSVRVEAVSRGAK